MSSITRRRALVALAATAALASAWFTSARAQDPLGRTLTFFEPDKGSTFNHIHNTKGAPRTSNLQGDVIALTNPVLDGDRKRIGTLHLQCVTTVGALRFTRSVATCSGVVALHDGSLMVQTDLRPIPGATVDVAVTGGTGVYAGSRGVLVSRPVKGGSQDTVTLMD
jgi:hypothetical protein